jgi:hypothetical protein
LSKLQFFRNIHSQSACAKHVRIKP